MGKNDDIDIETPLLLQDTIRVSLEETVSRNVRQRSIPKSRRNGMENLLVKFRE